MLNEFKAFIAKGNVMDLAVGVIIGGAFGKIVTSLVNDIIMPIVGALFGGIDFSNYFLALSDKVTATTLAAAREQEQYRKEIIRGKIQIEKREDQQRGGIGMFRVAKQVVDIRHFADVSGIHHADAVAGFRDDAQIMRNQQHGRNIFLF